MKPDVKKLQITKSDDSLKDLECSDVKTFTDTQSIATPARVISKRNFKKRHVLSLKKFQGEIFGELGGLRCRLCASFENRK